MTRNPKQYLLVHWDYATVSMVEMTPESVAAYQLLFSPHNLWRVEYRNDGRALMTERINGEEIEAPRVEILSHRTRQLMIERAFPEDAASNDNALLFNAEEAMQASV